MQFCVSSAEIKDFLAKLNSLESTDNMNETMGGVNCKYYESNEFSALKKDNNKLSLLHLNIASLSKHIDEFKVLLGQLQHDFSIIGITETGFQNKNPIVNCALSGYSYTHTPEKGVKSGP